MMDISTDVVRAYLTKIGKTVSDAEALTQAEFNAFVEEVHHKTGESKVWLLRILDNVELVSAKVIEHIREILGAEAPQESAASIAARAAAVEKAAADKAAAEAKAVQDEADAKAAEDAAAAQAAADQAASDAQIAADAAALAAADQAAADAAVLAAAQDPKTQE